MAIILKVTPEVLTQMSGEIEKELNDIESQFQSLETEINRTRAYWEGEASDMHKSKYDDMKDEIAESLKRLKDHPTNLLKMAGIYTQTEQEATQAAQSLLGDVIV
ncbi:MAG: WXG100 family type VII secretion target [Eubacteriales bacterium]|nr:WXG100 family type VII secretion target [Eubacteriales bacterium]